MRKCRKGHDLDTNGFPIRGSSATGCRACRQDAANARWESRWTSDSQYSDPLAARFWPKVDKRGDDECWPWLGAKIPSGYGSLGSVEVNGKRVTQTGAHRVAFFLAHGFWSRITRHTCDNPPCVNPAHLLDGDTRSNARDMVERGRAPASQRTHCPQGHEYNDENTWRTERGHRRCRACARENAPIAAAKAKAKDPERVKALARERTRRYRERRRAASA